MTQTPSLRPLRSRPRKPFRRALTWPRLLRWCGVLLFCAVLLGGGDLFALADASEAAPKAGEAKESADHGGGGGHHAPEANILLGIVIILLAAKVGGDLFERIGMPAVLGELTVGVIIGNWTMITGDASLDFLHAGPDGKVIGILANIGVILLLFEVGLESNVSEMVSVGTSAFLVAVYGVVAPILLGFGVGMLGFSMGWIELPSDKLAEWQVNLFLGATLCATSVGITARVLKDVKQMHRKESKIILGAAVIDDVMGLIVLAVVVGIAEAGEASMLEVLKIIGLAVAFLAGALALGAMKAPKWMFTAASKLRGHGLLVTTALVICFGLSWAATLVGLATIIGAFAAGLILENAHYREAHEQWEDHELEEAIAPISALLVPIFFVAMGMQVDLNEFKDPSVWMLAITLTVAAVIGKQVCAFGVLEKGLNKPAVGLGMIPRGEVGLIFLKAGQQAGVFTGGAVSAIVVMVMITTMVTPPLLKWSMLRNQPAGDGDSSAESTAGGDESPPAEE